MTDFANRLTQTNKALYIVLSMIVNGQLNMAIERSIPLGSIKYIALSQLCDDWIGIGVGSPQEPDPLISCIFKTEFVTRLKRLIPSMDLRIGQTIEYSKKPGKLASVKFVMDTHVPRGDIYKSGTVHVAPGEPASSVSRPTPRKKGAAGRTAAAPKSVPNGRAVTPRVTAASQSPAPAPAVAAAKHAIVSSNTHARTPSSSRAPPPLPPSAPAKTVQSIYRVVYDFKGQSATELTVKKDEIIMITKKEGAGWWLAKSPMGGEGWVPSSYIKEEQPAGAPKPVPQASRPAAPSAPAAKAPAPQKASTRAAPPPRLMNGNTRAKPAPPAPPKARPAAAGRGKPQAPPARPTHTTTDDALRGGTSTATASHASIANLADILRARSSSTLQEDDEEDW